jgi:hypothetical protein
VARNARATCPLGEPKPTVTGGAACRARACKSASDRTGEAAGTMTIIEVEPIPDTGWKLSTGS